MRSRILALALGTALLACGSQESKLERGIAVGPEEAAPTAERELEMTEEARRKQLQAEEAKQEAEEFERAQEQP